MERHPMTKNGAQALEAELERRRKKDRPRIVRAIAEARAHGDLSENAEYHAAKEEQGFNEGRIRELEAKLSAAQIIDISDFPKSDKVIFGATVKLHIVEQGSEVQYQIVGEDESDIKQNKISFKSPIGRSLIGKHVDDVVEVDTPKGMVSYEIIDVLY
jgi:transcription elongation factor GreA